MPNKYNQKSLNQETIINKRNYIVPTGVDRKPWITGYSVLVLKDNYKLCIHDIFPHLSDQNVFHRKGMCDAFRLVRLYP